MSITKNWKIISNLEVNYEIVFTKNIFAKDNPEVLKYGNSGSKIKRLLIVDKNVSDLYMEQIIIYFDSNNVITKFLILDGGEE